ncbi:unnamed protein product [Protopolystoma xenopodis]|uniref:Uncharacterized protein n=1 Tax=Protopolystoma xenopodis TaxID=117903 RepID=A0A3S5A647_9PLAT|nr:unnamed protein product [Protopolystoma xenopodis]
MSRIRNADPVFMQYIWSAVESCKSSATDASLINIYNILHSGDDRITLEKVQQELIYCVGDGSIILRDDVYSIPTTFDSCLTSKHDWYCFECHLPGCTIYCPTCFRVYHADCLENAEASQATNRLPRECLGDKQPINSRDFPPNGPCAVCRRLAEASSYKEEKVGDLHQIFLVALEKMKHKLHWKNMQKVGYLDDFSRNSFLMFKQLNTRILSEKLRIPCPYPNSYSNRSSLLADLDILVHNAAVVYHSKDSMNNMARLIRSQLRHEMRESTFCVDCYMRSKPGKTGKQKDAVSRLTAACREPHRLIWFQHNGFSFRPCKVLFENSDGYEVVCFGWRHEREFVLRSRAANISFTASELGLRQTPPLKKALDELEEYRANQAAAKNAKFLSSIAPTSHLNSRPPVTWTSNNSNNSLPTPSGSEASGQLSIPKVRKRTALETDSDFDDETLYLEPELNDSFAPVKKRGRKSKRRHKFHSHLQNIPQTSKGSRQSPHLHADLRLRGPDFMSSIWAYNYSNAPIRYYVLYIRRGVLSSVRRLSILPALAVVPVLCMAHSSTVFLSLVLFLTSFVSALTSLSGCLGDVYACLSHTLDGIAVCPLHHPTSFACGRKTFCLRPHLLSLSFFRLALRMAWPKFCRLLMALPGTCLAFGRHPVFSRVVCAKSVEWASECAS